MKPSSRRRALAAGRWALAALVSTASLVAAQQQEPALDAVLARAGTYVIDFQRRLSGVVAEEAYVQSVRIPFGTSSRATQLLPRHRELKSDLLLVKPAGVDR